MRRRIEFDMRKDMKVTKKVYTSSDTQSSKDGKHWTPAKPVLYSPSLFERLDHLFGKHWSYGQPYCIVCGREEAK